MKGTSLSNDRMEYFKVEASYPWILDPVASTKVALEIFLVIS